MISIPRALLIGLLCLVYGAIFGYWLGVLLTKNW